LSVRKAFNPLIMGVYAIGDAIIVVCFKRGEYRKKTIGMEKLKKIL